MRGRRHAAVAIAVLLLGCGGRDLAPYEAALDDLALPTTWQVVQSTTRSQGGPNGCVELINGNCPSITRYFAVAGSLPDIFRQARDASGADGFADVNVGDPTCATTTSPVAPVCFLVAKKGDMVLEVTLYRPDTDVDGLGISVPDRATVRMILHRN